jgi:hypothetical protein
MNDISKYLLDRLDKSIETSRASGGIAVAAMIPFAIAVANAQADNRELIPEFWPVGAVLTVVIVGALGMWIVGLRLQDVEQKKLVRLLRAGARQQADAERSLGELDAVLRAKPLWQKRQWLVNARIAVVAIPLAWIWGDLLDIFPCWFDPYQGVCPHGASAEGISTFDPVAAKDGLAQNGKGLRDWNVDDRDSPNYKPDYKYEAALFLGTKSSDARSIIGSQDRKLLEMTFLQNVPANRAKIAFGSAIASNVDPAYALNGDEIRGLTKAMTIGIKKNDVLRLYFHDESMEVALNNTVRRIVTAKQGRALISAFIGETPVDQPMCLGLLGTSEPPACGLQSAEIAN